MDSTTQPRTAAALFAALERLRALESTAERWQTELSALSAGLADAIIHGDVESLEAVPERLRDGIAHMLEDTGHAREIRGWLLGLLALTEWSLQRLPSRAELELADDTQGHRFLGELERAGGSLTGAELRERLGVDDSSLSRTGRKLLGRGLVTQRRLGRSARWELSPRGRQLLRHVQDAESPPAADGGAAGKTPRGRRHSV